MNRRILVVGTNYAPELTGIGPYTALLAESLADAGMPVSVLTGMPHYPEWQVHPAFRRSVVRRDRLNDVEVLRLRHPVPRNPDLRSRALMDGAFLTAAIGPVTASRAGAIIAITPSLAGLAAAVLGRRGRPVGVVVQDLTGAAAAQTGAAGDTAASAIWRAEIGLLRRASLIGVVAESFANQLLDGGLDPSKIVDLPNPSRIRASGLSVLEARATLGWSTDRPLVVHTGNMGRKQGLENVVDAAVLLPEVDFAFVGDGNQRTHLEEYAAKRRVTNLRFIPPVAEEVYPAVLAAADLLVLSEASTVEAMSLPSKITSYVTANRPLVAAVKPGGITAVHLSKHRIAHVVEPSGQQIAEGIAAVLADESIRLACASAQDEMVKLLSAQGAAERYVSFARRLLS